MVEQASPAASHRSRTRLVVQVVLSLVLVVAFFYFLRRRIDPAQTWAAITAMTWLELATLGLLAIWNLCTYAFVWMSVTPGLGFWRAMVMTQATTAVANTVPGGSAIGIGMTYGMLGSWGQLSGPSGHQLVSPPRAGGPPSASGRDPLHMFEA